MSNDMKGILKTTLFLAALLTSNVMAAPQDWQKIKRPVTGEPTPIGSYTNGCIIGAQALPYKGDGYQVIRMNKNRYYGHPDMIKYLTIQRIFHLYIGVSKTITLHHDQLQIEEIPLVTTIDCVLVFCLFTHFNSTYFIRKIGKAHV